MAVQALKTIDHCSTAWLSDALDSPVRTFQAKEILGEGYASKMYRLHLEYEQQSDEENLPNTLILKLATQQSVQVDLMEENTLFREVNFYQGPGAELIDITPKIYVATGDLETLSITLLMEDLGEIPHKPFRENLENSLIAMDVLATIHAIFWDADVLKTREFSPIASEITESNLLALLQENLFAEAKADYEFTYLSRCMRHLVKLLPWLLGETDEFRGATTLIHGDFHTRNLLIDHNKAKIFDWQVTERGVPAKDVAYWILTNVDVEDVDEFKPLLIDRYLSSLKAAGVQDYSRNVFRRDYFEIVGELIPRMFCYQTLITLSDSDKHELENFLARSEKAAKTQYLLPTLILLRLLAPPVVTLLRLIGKR